MDLELLGKVAVVTAASKGIGLAIVKALAGEGAWVIAGARTTASLEQISIAPIRTRAFHGSRLDVRAVSCAPGGRAGGSLHFAIRAAHSLDLVANPVVVKDLRVPRGAHLR
jgi:NAD(P)-dependent dehydrogenase (short-subunit alcohol dehydrogenase family)